MFSLPLSVFLFGLFFVFSPLCVVFGEKIHVSVDVSLDEIPSSPSTHMPMQHAHLLIPSDWASSVSPNATIVSAEGLSALSSTAEGTVKYPLIVTQKGQPHEIVDFDESHSKCLFAGDCIAVGLYFLVSPTHKSFSHACSFSAKVGISSGVIGSRLVESQKTQMGKHMDFAVISAGSNDPTNPRLSANLLEIRQSVAAAKTVVWIVPQNSNAAENVKHMAEKHGDLTVTFVSGGDHVHPKNYNTLITDIENLLKQQKH